MPVEEIAFLRAEMLTKDATSLKQGGAMYSPPQEETLRSFHQTFSTSYDNIKQRRFSLLNVVPGATVTGFVVTIFSDPTKNQALLNLVFPLGIAGALFVVGLFFVVRVSFHDGEETLRKIQAIEQALGITPQSREESPIFNQKNAVGIIFSGAVGGWICLAFWFVIPGFAIFLALAVLLVSGFISFPLLRTA